MAAKRPSARASVLRSALLISPFLAVTLIALTFLILDVAAEEASGGRIVGLVLVSSVTLLLGYQVIQSVRDLFSQTVETVGIVERRWSRSDFFLFRNSYVFVGKDVYRITPEEYFEIELGDTVRVRHYPHTSTIEEIEVVARADQSKEQTDG